MKQVKSVSIGVCIVAFLYATGLLGILINAVLVIGFAGVGLYCGVACSLNTSRKYHPATKPLPERQTTVLFRRMSEARAKYKPPHRKIVTTHNLDSALQEISELVVDEFVVSWYKELGEDGDRIKELLLNDIWTSIEILSERLSNVDMVGLLTKDLVEALTEHLAAIRRANIQKKSPQFEHFMLYPWLANSEKEMRLVRLMADVCVLHLLLPAYSATPAAAHFARELLATCVIEPTMSMLCSPDYINQKLYGWLDYREALHFEHRRTYAAAATYEEYMKMIERCRDVEHLKQMRYDIMSEIIHATSIQNLKRMQGQSITKEMSSKSNAKGDLLRARNLTRYLNQLAVCKKFCEKQIHFHGGPDYKEYDDEYQQATSKHSKKILAFSVIMNSVEARAEFHKFLKRMDKESLCGFWSAVAALKGESARELHHSGTKIYQMYIAHPSSAVRALIDRTLIKGMEAFLLGNTGPNSFFSAQDIVYRSLEEKHYPSFIISDIYDAFISTLSVSALQASHTDSPGPASKDSPRLDARKQGVKDRARIEEHSTYAQGKLKDLDDKIINKSRALKAMKTSQKSEKMMRLQDDLQEEIDTLKNQRRQLDFHIERTDRWADNIGKWKATICNHEIIEEGKQRVVYFVIMVVPSNLNPNADTQGWILTRKLDEFRLLHKQLYQIEPKLKQVKLPLNRRLKAGGEEPLRKAKDTLQDYLNTVLSSQQVAQSEVVYAFFSPSPEHLKYATATGQKKGSFLSSIFSRVDNDESDSDDELLFADDESAREVDAKDSIAEPFYEFIQELSEVKGVFKWFRRTFIVFVKVTFGRSVNRQLYRMVDWLYCEPMLLYYLRLFRESYWPEGAERQPLITRPLQEQIRTRFLAKTKIEANMPEAVKNLIGDVNARRGAIKAFEALQDERLNKQFFYTIQELLLKEIIPEIQEAQDNKLDAIVVL